MQTEKLFRILISENHEIGQSLGLSSSAARGIAGHATQGAQTEQEQVDGVLNAAENFQEHIQSLIDAAEDGSTDDEFLKNDLAILSAMKDWKYDSGELEQLAREDWAELH